MKTIIILSRITIVVAILFVLFASSTLDRLTSVYYNQDRVLTIVLYALSLLSALVAIILKVMKKDIQLRRYVLIIFFTSFMVALVSHLVFLQINVWGI